MTADAVASPDREVGDGVYLSRSQVAERLGLKSIHSLSGLNLPDPDVMVGNHAGWLPATIDRWNDERPGKGYWGQR